MYLIIWFLSLQTYFWIQSIYTEINFVSEKEKGVFLIFLKFFLDVHLYKLLELLTINVPQSSGQTASKLHFMGGESLEAAWLTTRDSGSK